MLTIAQYVIALLAVFALYFWVRRTILHYDEEVHRQYWSSPRNNPSYPDIRRDFAEKGFEWYRGSLITAIVSTGAAVALILLRLPPSHVSEPDVFWGRYLDWAFWHSTPGAAAAAFVSRAASRIAAILPPGVPRLAIFCLFLPAMHQLVTQWVAKARGYEWGFLHWGNYSGYRSCYFEFYARLVCSIAPVVFLAWLANSREFAALIAGSQTQAQWMVQAGIRTNALSLAVELIAGLSVILHVWTIGRQVWTIGRQNWRGRTEHFVDLVVAQAAVICTVIGLHLCIRNWNVLALLLMLGFNLCGAVQILFVPLRSRIGARRYARA